MADVTSPRGEDFRVVEPQPVPLRQYADPGPRPETHTAIALRFAREDLARVQAVTAWAVAKRITTPAMAEETLRPLQERVAALEAYQAQHGH